MYGGSKIGFAARSTFFERTRDEILRVGRPQAGAALEKRMRTAGAEDADGGLGGDATGDDVGVTTAPLGAPRGRVLARPPADVGRPVTVDGRERDAPRDRPGRVGRARMARAVMATRARLRWRERAERSRSRAPGHRGRRAAQGARAVDATAAAYLRQDSARMAAATRASRARRPRRVERAWSEF